LKEGSGIGIDGQEKSETNTLNTLAKVEKQFQPKFTFCAESHTDCESAGRPLASNLIGQAKKCKPWLLGKGYWARLPKKMTFKSKLDFLRSFGPFWAAILTFGKFSVGTNLKKIKRS